MFRYANGYKTGTMIDTIIKRCERNVNGSDGTEQSSVPAGLNYTLGTTEGSFTVSFYDSTKLFSVYLDMKSSDATAQGNRTVPIINGLKDANFPAATNAKNAIVQKWNREGTYVEKRLGKYFEEAETAK
jgi:hypothetical protein